MKQRVVIKLSTGSRKYQSKAMKTAAGLRGVESMTMIGENRDLLMVIGSSIDAVDLTTLLRKKLGFAELTSVMPVWEAGEAENWKDFSYGSSVHPEICPPHLQASIPPYYIHDVGMNNQENCVIL